MLRIAICDDEPAAVARHEAITRSALQGCGVSGEITAYTQSRNLLADVQDDGFFFDLILLDIEMPGVDGMALARQLRSCLPNVRIIFVTSHTEYAIDAFELSIFRYVPKHNLEEKLPAAVLDAARLIQLETGRTYVLHSAGRLEKLLYRDILYIRREGKNAVLVTANGPRRVRKSLQQVFDELNAPEFLFLDRGCIANLLQIMQIRGSEAVLKSGEVLPISRSHLQEVKEKLNRFWGEQI